MISAIGAIGSNRQDSEYERIILELKKRNMYITGNKSIDKAHLQEVKQKELEAKENVQARIEINPDNSDKEREALEELKTGAMNLAEINKILHGL